MSKLVPPGFAELDVKSPFNKLIGPIYGCVRDGVPIMAMRMGHQHENPYGNTTHGGMIAALADNALGWGLKQRHPKMGDFVTTHLSTDYLSAITTNDWVEAHVNIIKVGRRLNFVDCTMYVDGRIVAKSSGQFMVA